MLILQFLTDSVVISFIALFLAVIIVFISLPFFNNLLDVKISFNLFKQLLHYSGPATFCSCGWDTRWYLSCILPFLFQPQYRTKR